MARHTVNGGLVRIQYKCLVPIDVFPETKLHGLVISKTELDSIFTFMYLWAIYIFPESVCLFCCSQINRLVLGIQYINRSQVHECRNWERGCAVSFLGIPKSDFQYSALADSTQEGYIEENQHILSNILVFLYVFVMWGLRIYDSIGLTWRIVTGSNSLWLSM